MSSSNRSEDPEVGVSSRQKKCGLNTNTAGNDVTKNAFDNIYLTYQFNFMHHSSKFQMETNPFSM